MAHYRSIDVRIWNDRKFNSLSDEAKLLFIFLLTHPYLTSVGAMRASLDGLASELKWFPERLRQRFEELVRNGMANHDEINSFLLLPNFLKYNQPANPNSAINGLRALEMLPECELKDTVMESFNLLIENKLSIWEKLPKGFEEEYLERLLKPLGKRLPKRLP